MFFAGYWYWPHWPLLILGMSHLISINLFTDKFRNLSWHSPGDFRAMATFLYKCPATGQHVQAWVADDGEDSNDRYHAIICLACKRVHSVNPKTRKVLGSDDK